jgi:hypothetical protein
MIVVMRLMKAVNFSMILFIKNESPTWFKKVARNPRGIKKPTNGTMIKFAKNPKRFVKRKKFNADGANSIWTRTENSNVLRRVFEVMIDMKDQDFIKTTMII